MELFSSHLLLLRWALETNRPYPSAYVFRKTDVYKPSMLLKILRVLALLFIVSGIVMGV